MSLARTGLGLSTMFFLACAGATGQGSGVTAGKGGSGATTGNNNNPGASTGTTGSDNGSGTTASTGGVTGNSTGAVSGGLTGGTSGGGNGAATGGGNGSGTLDPSCDPSLLDINGCPCPALGDTRACYTGPSSTENVGACKDGQQTCEQRGEFLVWGDCGGDVKPATEMCTGTGDENCNGLVGCADPTCPGIAGCCAPGATRSCYDGPSGTGGVGICSSGTQTCDSNGAWKACTSETLPSMEAGNCADGVDNDCNGLIDCKDPACASDPVCAPPVCAVGATRSCYDGAMGTAGVGQCKTGLNTCDPSGKAWGTACVGEVVPSGEAGHCSDGIDNDCNGLKDCLDPACNGDPACACVPNSTRACYTGPAGTADVGICKSGSQTCNGVGSAWGPCLGSITPSVEAGACNDGKDNDCDGLTDCQDSSCTFAANCCVPTTSYNVNIYATSGTSLYLIDPSDWSESAIGSYGSTENMTDVAMTPDGNVYTMSSTSLYHINLSTGAATKVMTLTGSLNNALTFLPDNRLLAADAGGTLKVIDPGAGTVTNIGSYANGYGSSGDLVAVGDGTMFGVSATAKGGGDISTNNLLITVDTSTGAASPIGSIGYGNVFGIAYYGSRVIAFTGSGQIIEINPTTGAGTLLKTHSHAYYGGTTSPLIPINGCS